ncbi:formimidoylglutamase [Flavobacterium filum]|uniref:formimidoylglutamase n=1 Tax=Flavobacterium TaxID=237 RepID=UPI0004163CB4|nr:formimidoylglutamase [Flavobacterium filum]
MAFDFLTPVSDEVIAFVDQLNVQTLGKKVAFHSQVDFPDLNKITIAIIGVLDSRGNKYLPTEVSLDELRKQLYQLFPGNWVSSIADLGDIEQGATQEDTYYAVSKINAELIKKGIIPIIIGGSQDITYAMYRAYDKLDQMVNLVSVDYKFDFGKDESQHTVDSYLSKMIINEPNNLFNYSNIGYQTYFNSQEEIDLIEKLYFDAYRLGDISADISISEPVFRDADIVSVDLGAVKSSDSNCLLPFMPNGFNGKEICALSRYSGISDKVTSYGIFNHSNEKGEFVLMAQMIWYFIEGFNYRSKEYPIIDKSGFMKYIVPVDDIELLFYKSSISQRWWVELPFFNNVNNKLIKNTLLPCTHEDYLRACDQEIPERWWKAQRKDIV